MKRIFSIAFFFLALCLVTTAHAQTDVPLPDNTEFSITPEHPGPNEVVLVQIENYAQDLNALEISWFLNGQLQKKAVGDKKFQFTTGALGSVSNVKVSTTGFSKEITIRPAGLDLIWQTRGYTPPFYKGKALYTYQSAVDFIAMPSFIASSGVAIDPKTLVYKWSRNGTVLSDVSGYGKNVLSTSGGVLAKALSIDLEVSTVDGSMRAEKSIELQGAQPEIFLYENHPLYGIMYNKVVPSQFTLDKKEITLSSAPYFFDVNRKDDQSLVYEWSMNNQKVANQTNPNSLILRRPDGSPGGEALVGLTISKTDKNLQFKDSSTRIRFEAEESTPTI